MNTALSCGELSCDECNARTVALTAERDQLRAELTDQAARFHDEIARRQEVVRDNKALDLKERDQLRAEVAWWKNWHEENEKLEDGIAVKVQATIDGLRAEVERLKAKISNQAYRIRYLEGATNHATGTPLSQANARAERAEAELKRYNDAVDAQPWASDEPIRVLLDRITIRLAAAEKSAALVGRLRRALADAISTYDPNRKETLVTAERQEAWIAALQEDAK